MTNRKAQERAQEEEILGLSWIVPKVQEESRRGTTPTVAVRLLYLSRLQLLVLLLVYYSGIEKFLHQVHDVVFRHSGSPFISLR